MGKNLASRSTRPTLQWTFGVLDSEVVNAVSAPGGYVFVTRGLLKRVSNEAALAGVLSHEIAHVTRKDAFAIYQKTKVDQCKSLAYAKAGQKEGAAVLRSYTPGFINQAYAALQAFSGGALDLNAARTTRCSPCSATSSSTATSRAATRATRRSRRTPPASRSPWRRGTARAASWTSSARCPGAELLPPRAGCRVASMKLLLGKTRMASMSSAAPGSPFSPFNQDVSQLPLLPLHDELAAPAGNPPATSNGRPAHEPTCWSDPPSVSAGAASVSARWTDSSALPGLEQLGALGGEIRHLAGEGVPLGAQHFHALAKLHPVVAEALELSGQPLLLGETVGELRILSGHIGCRQPLALLVLRRRLRPRPARRKRLVPLALDRLQLALQLRQQTRALLHLRREPSPLLHRPRASSVARSAERRAASRSCWRAALCCFTWVRLGLEMGDALDGEHAGRGHAGRQRLGNEVLANSAEPLPQTLAPRGGVVEGVLRGLARDGGGSPGGGATTVSVRTVVDGRRSAMAPATGRRGRDRRWRCGPAGRGRAGGGEEARLGADTVEGADERLEGGAAAARPDR